MGKSSATPRPSVSEVTVMMITAATSCQREIWIRLLMYCRKGRLGDAAKGLCSSRADSLRATGMVQTIAEGAGAEDCQHGHRCSVLTNKARYGVSGCGYIGRVLGQRQ